MKILLASLLIAAAVSVSSVPFKLLSAEVSDVRLPDLGVKKQRRYDRALVIRIAVDQRTYDSLPPDIAAFLYLGDHELHPFKIDRLAEGGMVVITFHDPNWQTIAGPVPMVLTTRHGDPIVHPERYREAPRFDPKSVPYRSLSSTNSSASSSVSFAGDAANGSSAVRARAA